MGRRRRKVRKAKRKMDRLKKKRGSQESKRSSEAKDGRNTPKAKNHGKGQSSKA